MFSEGKDAKTLDTENILFVKHIKNESFIFICAVIIYKLPLTGKCPPPPTHTHQWFLNSYFPHDFTKWSGALVIWHVD